MHPVPKNKFGTGKTKVFYYNGSSIATGYIVKQVGLKSYMVTTDGVTKYRVYLAPTEALAKRLDGTAPLGTKTELTNLATITMNVGGNTKYVTRLNSVTANTADGFMYSWTLGTATAKIFAVTKHTA